MRRKVSRISIHRTSLTVALMYGGAVFVIGIALAILGTPLALIGIDLLDVGGGGLVWWWVISIGIAVVGGILYAVLAYIFTALGTFVYNLAAKLTGGVEFTLSE